jgi:hypothetical protein
MKSIPHVLPDDQIDLVLFGQEVTFIHPKPSQVKVWLNESDQRFARRVDKVYALSLCVNFDRRSGRFAVQLFLNYSRSGKSGVSLIQIENVQAEYRVAEREALQEMLQELIRQLQNSDNTLTLPTPTIPEPGAPDAVSRTVAADTPSLLGVLRRVFREFLS